MHIIGLKANGALKNIYIYKTHNPAYISIYIKNIRMLCEHIIKYICDLNALYNRKISSDMDLCTVSGNSSYIELFKETGTVL